MSITEALIVEHSALIQVFDQIEALLPETESLGEAQRLALLVEGALRSHAQREEDLAFAALDHVLANEGEIDHLYQDHHEINANLGRARNAEDLETARRLLKISLRVTREHFRREEQSIFPLIDLCLQPGTNRVLGRAFAQVTEEDWSPG